MRERLATSPRLWRWRLQVSMDRVAGAVMVGVLVAKDDDESWSVSIGLVVVNVHFTGYQVLTRSEQRHRAEQLVIAEAERIAKEAAAP